MLLCPMGTRKMGLGVSSPRAQQPKTGLQTATQSVINCSGCEMAGLAGMLAPGTLQACSKLFLQCGGAHGEREQGWTPWERWDAWKEEKGKGLGMSSSPRGKVREAASASASLSPFGASQDLSAPQMGFPAWPPKTPSQ